MSILKLKDSQGNWVGVPTLKGDKGNGISSAVLNNDYTLTLTFTDGTSYTTPSIRGEKGEKGDPASSMNIHICSSNEYDSETRIPTITSPDDKTFYLVPTEDGTSPDLFTEWVYVNNAWEMFGSASVDLSGYLTDVTVGGNSVVTDGVANIPIANTARLGVVKIKNDFGVMANNNGELAINGATTSEIKNGTANFKAITPIHQHESTFYGLAQASGTDERTSELPFGQYTDEAKSSIQDMLDVPSTSELKEVNDSKADVIVESASGDIVSFDDGADNMPLKSLVVDINPVQDLNGYDHPWVGGGGVNKWDEQWEVGSLTWTGADATGTDRIRSKNYVPVAEGETYRVVTSNNLQFFYYDSSKTFVSYEQNSKANGATITIPTGCAYLRFYTYGSTYGETYKNDIAINYPSTVTTYSPYENICPITGWTGVDIEVCGKNLLTATEYGGTYNGVNGTDLKAMGYAQELIQTGNTVQINVQNTWKGRTFATAPLKAGNYIVGFNCDSSNIRATVYVVDNDLVTKRVCRNVASSGSNLAYPVVEDGERIAVYICSNAVGILTITDLTVNLGTTDANYDQYKGRTINVNWETEAGTVYGGSLDVLSGVLRVDRLGLDGGDLSWAKVDSYNYGNFYVLPTPLASYVTTRPTIISSSYKSESNQTASSTNDCYVWIRSVSSSNRRIYVKDTSKASMTAEEFRTAMTGVQFIYELAEPIEIQLTPQEVKSLLGTNNIWANTGNTSVEYCADTEMYIADQISDVPVSDVQINGTSIITDGVANVPIGLNKVGAVQISGNSAYGLNINGNTGFVTVASANDAEVKAGTLGQKPIAPQRQHMSTFYGLAKSAGDTTQSASSNAVGNYTEEAKASIQNMLGITDKYSPKEWIAESETELVTNAHNIGDLFYIGETLYKVIADLNAGDAINVGVNVEEVDVNNILTDYATKEDVQDNVSIVEKSASGTIVSIDDGVENSPLKKMVVDINPVQDLHGYDSPWVGGGGKNLLPTTVTEIKTLNTAGTWNGNAYTLNGVTFTIVTDDAGNVTGITVSGTASATARLTSGGGSSSYNMRVYPSSGTAIATDTGNGATFEYQDGYFVAITVVKETAISSPITYKPMVRIATDADTSFAPYENICPISGWTSVDVEQRGVNAWDEEAESGYFYTSNGAPASSNEAYRSKNYIPVKPNTTYFLKNDNHATNSKVVRFFFYDKNKTFIISPSGDTASRVFTVPDNAYFMRFYVLEGIENYTNTLSINYPSTDHSYHPYTGRSITIDLGQTVYGGKLDVLSGVLTVDMAMVDLGTLTWSYQTSPDGIKLPRFASASIASAINKDIDVQGGLVGETACSALVLSKSVVVSRTIDHAYCALTATGLLYVVDTDYSDVASFTSGMSGVQLLYPLAEPIEIQLDAYTLNSLYGQNNIFADTGDISCEYFSQVDEDLVDYIKANLNSYAKKELLNDYVDDIQINGTSIVTDGVANVPIADIDTLGAVQMTSSIYSGLRVVNGYIATAPKGETTIKEGQNTACPIVPQTQHYSAFYGLAKAAGDATQSASSNTVGNYTDEAKSAISDMLNGAVQISGTDPIIVAKSGIRYVCGEVLSLDFTPSVSGICDVVFISGSTPTVLTVPSTIKWANGFDPTSLDANTTYEINIMDGLGVACAWT